MCKETTNIKFCTCEDDSKEKGKEIKSFSWSLSREIESLNIKGKIKFPANDLGQGVSKEKVLQLLNEGEPFDFSFTPQQHDVFHIGNGKEHPDYEYMSFKFQNGKWVAGGRAFTKRESLGEGKIFKSES